MKRASVCLPAPASPTSRTGGVDPAGQPRLFAEQAKGRRPRSAVSGPALRHRVPQGDEPFRQGRGGAGSTAGADVIRPRISTAAVSPCWRSGKKSTSHQRRAGSRPGSSRRTRAVAPADFGRRRHRVFDDGLEGVAGVGGPRTAADEQVCLRGGNAGETFPGRVDIEEPAAAVENEDRVGRPREERLPAKCLGQRPGPGRLSPARREEGSGSGAEGSVMAAAQKRLTT